MSERINDVKKRIAKRRKERSPFAEGGAVESRVYPLPKDEERYGEMPFMDYEHSPRLNQPVFRKEVMMFQVLVALTMFLVVGILFKDNSPQWESARAFISQSMDKEFQFATVLNWYEDQFGQPVALLPNVDNNEQMNQPETQYVNSEDPTTKPVFAVPVAGRVLEPFDKDGQGIMVETGRDSIVEVINDGVVIEIGVKDEIGKTVVVQHPDGSETWYGNLDEIDVKLYDFVKSRTQLGKVVNSEDGQTGTYYFAIKQNDHFIDPIQVINFE